MFAHSRTGKHACTLGTLGHWAVWLVAPTGKADVFTFKQYPVRQSPAVVMVCCVNEGLQNRFKKAKLFDTWHYKWYCFTEKLLVKCVNSVGY